MASAVKKLVTWLFVTALSLFWGSILLCILIFKFLQNPKKFFSCGSHDRLPSVAMDPQLGQHSHLRISSPNDKNMSMKIKYVAKGTKGDPLLLMIHGFPECWYSWRYQLREMQSTGRWMVAIDLPGYGDSDKPKGKQHYTMDSLVEYVAAIIRALGYEKAVVCGHDWGGVITWQFASRYPDMCEKIVVLNCPHRKAWAKVVRTQLKQFLASWYIFAFQIPYLPELLMGYDDMNVLQQVPSSLKNKERYSEEDVKVYKYSLRPWAARNAAINYYRCLLRPPTIQGLDKVKAPMLLIWGTEDAALTTDLAIASQKYAEDIRVEFIEGASHFVALDAYEKVNELLCDFLSE